MTPEQRCPLCAQPNRCTMAAGKPASLCWCFTATVDPAALERLAPEQRDRACLCPTCAGAARPTGNREDA